MNSAKKILIVEDEIVLQDVYKLILKTGGYDVHTANNGAEGLKKLVAVKPDLLLLDIFMPVMDGKELLRNVDKDDYPELCVIVYSNLHDKATEQEMLGLGADEFILKSSLTPNDLLDLVGQRLQ